MIEDNQGLMNMGDPMTVEGELGHLRGIVESMATAGAEDRKDRKAEGERFRDDYRRDLKAISERLDAQQATLNALSLNVAGLGNFRAAAVGYFAAIATIATVLCTAIVGIVGWLTGHVKL